MFAEKNRNYALETKFRRDRIFYACYPHPKFPTVSITGEACALNCKHCLPGTSPITTDSGAQPIGSVFEAVSKGSEVKVLTHEGKFKKVIMALKHPHDGKILKIKPSHLPPFECTPIHEIFSTPSLDKRPRLASAKDLKVGDYLWIPPPRFEERNEVIDLKQIIPQEIKSISKPRKLNSEKVEKILSSEASSFELGKELGLSPPYVRRIRKPLRNGTIARDGSKKKTVHLIENNGRIKYIGGKIWVPRFLKLERIAKLLGYYCAEGDISRHKKRPNSLFTRLSFGNKESKLIKDSCKLIKENFHVMPRIERGKTRTCVVIPGTPIAYMFLNLCGNGALNKRIPSQILGSSTQTIHAFLIGLINGDGSRTWDNEKRRRISLGSASKKLILDCIVLFLKLGYVASFTVKTRGESKIDGRPIYNKNQIYSISLRGWLAEKAENEIFGTRWAKRVRKRHHYMVKNGGFLLKIKKIEELFFKGDVFDLEVEGDHSFTCPYVAVSNCRGHYLKHMISCPTPDVLRKTCLELASDGARGVLLSGGYNEDGYVPFEPFIDEIERVKRETGLFMSAHTGLMPNWLAREIGRAGVDLADFDLIGDDETIELVLGIERTVKDYRRTFAELSRRLPHVVPHICIGLHAGELRGELTALEIAARSNCPTLVLLVLTPTVGTKFEGVDPPTPAAVGEVVARARLRLPEATLALGCMRPRGVERVEIELQALRSGIDRVEIPDARTIDAVRSMWLDVKRLDACCAVPIEDFIEV